MPKKKAAKPKFSKCGERLFEIPSSYIVNQTIKEFITDCDLRFLRKASRFWRNTSFVFLLIIIALLVVLSKAI